MRYLASVTFESQSGPAETHKQAIVAASHGKAASSAVKAAKAMFPGRRPCSIVIVLELDRETFPASEGYTDSGNMEYPPG